MSRSERLQRKNQRTVERLTETEWEIRERRSQLILQGVGFSQTAIPASDGFKIVQKRETGWQEGNSLFTLTEIVDPLDRAATFILDEKQTEKLEEGRAIETQTIFAFHPPSHLLRVSSFSLFINGATTPEDDALLPEKTQPILEDGTAADFQKLDRILENKTKPTARSNKLARWILSFRKGF